MNRSEEKNIQRLLVLQQRGRGETKTAGIKAYGQDRFHIDLVSVEERLPAVIEDTSAYLPETIDADLVLDYLAHPDLSCDLADKCRDRGIPVIASGKKYKNRWVYTPPICCALPRQADAGPYGQRFGYPEFAVTLSADNRIKDVRVVRGAPCGASWKAAEKMRGLPASDAVVRIGLETQFFCSADPAGWDPLWGKSPVHLAADLHAHAFIKAVEEGRKR
ncbi:DUF166 family (seleno)protein DfsP [Desulfosudis oleivorans]|uniref:Thymidylate synthase n=1 Tax=Desulfosudis oleivorans (strain DSM 6200 / JCM 39069 / Hxd3) TaxID=96561 RepID=A8ZX04_DESOH|nr:DUF166 family (seleno)protein DfsP [Desulfosudis oleivorans]ABW66860.1 conserved hypothetical protein [Desulfosudis oleivorans Hxd3]